jgi:hypothetical protein
MVESKKNALLKRIRALRERTMENGCTEAEALEAAAKVTELLDAYGFSEADLSLPVEEITEETFLGTTKMPLGQTAFVITAIAEYCDCKGWEQRVNNKPVGLRYFGRESDASVAMYLTHLCHTAMWSEWRAWMPNRDMTKRRSQERKEFQRGMASRLSARLREMKEARNQQHSGKRTGQDLVVLKNAVVDAAWAERQAKAVDKFKPGKTTMVPVSSTRLAGMAAAEKVAFNDGVTTGDKARQITKG